MRSALALVLLVTLGGCATATDLVRAAEGVTGTAQRAGMVPVSIYWHTNAGTLTNNVGDTVVAVCPPNGEPRQVWGTDVYTSDSSICTAAVHMGLITLQNGGTVTIQRRPGQDRYSGTLRNGIESAVYGRWGGSFVFVR